MQNRWVGSLSRNIPEFQNVNTMLLVLDPTISDGIKEKLRRDDAKYHGTCNILHNNTKLQRTQKRSPIVFTDTEKGCSTAKLH